MMCMDTCMDVYGFMMIVYLVKSKPLNIPEGPSGCPVSHLREPGASAPRSAVSGRCYAMGNALVKEALCS